MIFHCQDRPYVIYSLTHWWLFGQWAVLTFCFSCCEDLCTCFFCLNRCSVSLGLYTWEKIVHLLKVDYSQTGCKGLLNWDHKNSHRDGLFLPGEGDTGQMAVVLRLSYGSWGQLRQEHGNSFVGSSILLGRPEWVWTSWHTLNLWPSLRPLLVPGPHPAISLSNIAGEFANTHWVFSTLRPFQRCSTAWPGFLGCHNTCWLGVGFLLPTTDTTNSLEQRRGCMQRGYENLIFCALWSHISCWAPSQGACRVLIPADLKPDIVNYNNIY